MTRAFAAMLMALPMAALLAPAPAAAQSNSAQYFRDSNRIDQRNLPPPAMSREQEQGQISGPQRLLPEEQAAVPQPGYAPSNAATAQPQYGAQAPAANGDPNAIRPPGAVGAAPAAPPQQGQTSVMEQLPPEDQPETGKAKELPPNLKRQLVDFTTKEPAGTIVVDTANTYLFLVLGHGKAMRYGVRVGREGFTWTGTERISKMKEWPDWFPPPEMIERQPYLPRMMAGGPGNPLGARAMYLGHTLYRIHGTNQPSTIGHYVSSGCVGMLNEDVEDLYSRVQVGTRVVVLPGKAPETAANAATPPEPANPMAPPSRAPMQAARAPANPPPQNGAAVTGGSLPPLR
jgi:lipoprotein-anchoring transpeptidase ErfK/SrfK